MTAIQSFFHIWVPAKVNADKAATLLLLHGTGGSENDLLPITRRFGENVNLLSVRGKVLENGMNRFFKRLGEGIFDIPDLRFRTKELNDFLIEASSEYGFDSKKLVAFGYSNGANIAGGLLILFPETLAGAILLRPMIPFQPEADWKLPETKVLIAAGKTDFTMKPTEPKNWADLLTKAGAEVTLNIAQVGHNLSQEDLEISVKWLNEKF